MAEEKRSIYRECARHNECILSLPEAYEATDTDGLAEFFHNIGVSKH